MKSFIIRLKDNKISEKHALECIEQANTFGIKVKYFDAVNGNDYESHLQKLKIKPRYKFKKGRAGVYGCFLSHYYLWDMCSKGNDSFLILEHDGYFIRELPGDIEDRFTDVLKLDGHDPFSGRYNAVIESDSNLEFRVEPYINHQSKFLEKNQTGYYLRGAYSYIIKPHAAKKLVDWIANNGFVPADQQIGNAIVDIQVTVPTVARLHPAYFNNIRKLSLTGNPELL